jgi:hypothetical protein
VQNGINSPDDSTLASLIRAYRKKQREKLTFGEHPPVWFDWSERTAETEQIPPGVVTLFRGQELVLHVTVSSLSQTKRYPGLRNSSSAYYVSNVVLTKEGSIPALGDMAVRIDTHGNYSVAVERYSGPGRLMIVSLDGGSYDVKENPKV